MWEDLRCKSLFAPAVCAAISAQGSCFVATKKGQEIVRDKKK